MNTQPDAILLPTRRLEPALAELLRTLQPGDRIKVTQTVRVGGRKWTAEIVGEFRGMAYREPSITTERVKEDDVVVPVVRFTKPNGELTSITLDEHTKVERG